MSHPQASPSAAPCGNPMLGGRTSREDLLERVLPLLALRAEHLLVQVGAGRPDLLLALTKRVPLRFQALVVDPSLDRLAPFRGSPALRVCAMEPLRFAVFPMTCDRILLENAVLRGAGRDELTRRLFARLSPGGRLLAVGAGPALPPLASNGRRAAGLHTGSDGVLGALEGAGFEVQRVAAPSRDGRVHLVLGVKSLVAAS